MNLLEFHRNSTATRRPLSWRGTWARLWLKPSVFSAQSYVVGIAVLDATGLCDFRFISDTTKFECIYGESGRFHVDQLLALARQRLAYAREHHEPITQERMSTGFLLDPVGFIAGASASDAMDHAIDESEFPMEPSPDPTKAQRFRSRAAEEVVGAVMDAVRVKMGLKAEHVLQEDFFGDQAHQARVNIALPNRAGIIASGWYSGAERVQLELLRAVTTVQSYMSFSEKSGDAGVFFLRPTLATGLKREQSEAIENSLNQIDWQLQRKGLRVITREYESDLADDVAEWADAA